MRAIGGLRRRSSIVVEKIVFSLIAGLHEALAHGFGL
jgi:hypothetical protein